MGTTNDDRNLGLPALNIIWAHRLRAARHHAGLHQADLARAVGVSQQVISQWEGALSRPSDERRILLARALNLNVTELFAYPDDDPDNGDSEAA